MIYDEKTVEKEAVLQAAQSMCAAARTAPKTRGEDHLRTCVVTDESLDDLAQELERLAPVYGYDFFVRDAKNVRQSQAVVLIGTTYQQRGMNEGCQLCHFENCGECAKHDAVCVYDNLDLGIALGCAVSLAATLGIDNRIMFSVGKAALSLELLGDDIQSVFAIPLSVSGKSPFFDRKPQ